MANHDPVTSFSKNSLQVASMNWTSFLEKCPKWMHNSGQEVMHVKTVQVGPPIKGTYGIFHVCTLEGFDEMGIVTNASIVRIGASTIKKFPDLIIQNGISWVPTSYLTASQHAQSKTKMTQEVLHRAVELANDPAAFEKAMLDLPTPKLQTKYVDPLIQNATSGKVRTPLPSLSSSPTTDEMENLTNSINLLNDNVMDIASKVEDILAHLQGDSHEPRPNRPQTQGTDRQDEEDG